MKVDFEVNGKKVSANVDERTTLADCLRYELGLTGTHVGCEHGVCGACTVIVNGDAASFRKHHALQCGFCTPGMITTAHALLTHEPDADEERVRDVLSGNICRCTGYVPIVEAVLDARSAYGSKDK